MGNKVIKILEQPEDSSLNRPIIGNRTISLMNDIDLPDDSKNTIVSEACDILSHCLFPGQEGNRTNIAIGYVQSGKTMSFITLTALAADNGFKIIVYLTGTKTNLQNQTYKRLKSNFSKGGDFLSYRIFDDSLDSSSSTIYRIKNFMEIDNCVLLFPILKHYSHIDTLAEIMQSTSLHNLVSKNAVLIIDDEADQSSFNTYAKRNSNKKEYEKDEFSSTYLSILNLRSSFTNHSYIQYTATPQAAFLIDNNDILSPEYHTVLTPGEGYTGGKFFFENKDKNFVTIIPEDEVYHYDRNPLKIAPKSLILSIQEFLISVAIYVFIWKKEKFLSMMIHPDGRNDSNEKFYKWTSSFLQNWLSLFKGQEQDPGRELLINSFKKPYAEMTKYLVSAPSFKEVMKVMPNVIVLTHVHLVQGTKANKKQQPDIIWEEDLCHILVGADMLNRGFTIENLSMTYMPRRTKGKATADTIEQRCRFFGYKQKYADVCRIFIPQKSLEEYHLYVQHEEMLRYSLKNSNDVSDFSRKAKAMILSNNLKPTRNNILSKKLITNKLIGWHEMLSLDSVNKNKQIVEIFLSNFSDGAFNYCPENADNIQRNHRYVCLDIESFINFFKKIEYTSDISNIVRKTITIQYLNYLKEKAAIQYVYFFEIAYAAKGDQMRSRRIFNNKLRALMVGNSPNGQYLSDRHYKFEDSICVQLHHFNVVNSDKYKDVYNFTIYYPEHFSQDYIAIETDDE